MSETAWDDTKSEAKVQENVDQAVEEATDLEFATLEELEDVFRR